MKKSKRIMALLLTLLLIFSMMPTTTVTALAEETLAAVEEQENTGSANEEGKAAPQNSADTPEQETGGQAGETAEETKPEGSDEPSASDAGSESANSGTGSQEGQTAQLQAEAESTEQEGDTPKQAKAPVLKAASPDSEGSSDEEPGPLRAPSRAADITGNVSNGWIWRVAETEEGSYTLTFEYTGTADPAPAFVVPSNFIANISSELGDVQSQIKEVIVPEGCTTINTRAFQNLKNLERVEIGSTVTTIGTVVFGDNNANNASIRDTKLKEVVFKTNPETGKSALTRIEAGAFTGCTALSSVNLEDTQLIFLGYEAFRNCALQEVYIPDSIAKSTTSYNSQNSSYQIAGYAFADNPKLKSVSVPAFFYIPYTIATYTFANCTSLEDVDFREVDGAIVRTYNSGTLPNQIFLGDNSLKTIDLSAWTESTRSSSFSLTYNLFETSSTNSTTRISSLEKLILPEKPTTVGNYTFYNKTGINSWNQFDNEEYFTSIGERAFYGTRIVSNDMSHMTRLTTIGMEAFKNCESMTDLVIPAKVTSIGSAAFKNCDNLETVKIEAEKLTSVSYSNLFHGDDNLRKVTISDQTKQINGNVLASVPSDADTFFEGENIIQITKATASGGARPLKNLDGTYYVDSQGVLYKLSDNGNATLAYVPPEITAYTVPENFSTPDGNEYTVTGISAYALNLADDLESITFAKPENIYLMPSAFSGWSKSSDNMGKLVNGKAAIDPDDGWGRISSICDFPIKDEEEKLVPTIEDTILNSDGEPALQVAIVVKDKDPSDDNTYDYKTGQKASYLIAISNQDNVVMNKVVRIYFSYSEPGYNMGTFTVGEKPIVAPNGNIYPCKIVQTDDPNVYYYEITGLQPGDTVAVNNDIFYPSPTTGGGEVKVWTHTITPEEAAAREGDIINPGEFMELDWETTPVVFNYRKSNTTVYDPEQAKLNYPIIKMNEDGEAYVSSLAYLLAETNTGSSSTTEGLDYIRWVNYEDEITLPEELYWREDILDAIRAGKWSVEDTSTNYDYNGTSTISCKAVTVTVGGKKYYVAYLGTKTGYNYSYIDNLKVKVTDEGKLKLTWKVSNTSLSGASASNEYSVHTFYLRVGDGALLADLDKVNALLDETGADSLKDVLKVHNDTDEIRHYSYSPNQTAAAGVDTPVDANYDVAITKEYQVGNDSSSYIYGGKDDFFNITINNTGILNISTWGKATTDGDGNKTYNRTVATDTLSNWFYIMPSNIEKMLKAVATVGKGQNAQTAEIGKWLTITINKATLFTRNQYQPVDGTDQNNKYTTGSSSNLNANADNGIRGTYEGATITFRINENGDIQATLIGDPITDNNRTYTIGGAGCDYYSVEAFFNAIGYMPTANTQYAVNYTVPAEDDFMLKAGQKLVFPLLSTYKTTPMMLTYDRESYHQTSSTSVSNTANVSLKAGKEDISRNVYPFYKSGTYTYQRYHYWQHELYFYKDGYIENGSSITSSTNVPDGTVIDSRLYFYNYSNRAYDHMPVSDYMDGPQVALAPVAQNPELTAPDGSALETYVSNGVTYYLLNKPGEYKNVIFGSSSGRNGTQNLKADITVTQTINSSGKVTSLNTLTHWKPYENWGATTATTYIYYKTLVSASYAGMSGADNPGEVESYTLNNKGWLGDHQGHRLWDTYGVISRQYSFNKYIVTEDGAKDGTDTVAEGTLVKSSRVRQSDAVTYQIEINSISDSPSILSGNNIYDVLPATYGVFSWQKDINVTNLRYYGSDGVEITYGTGDDAKSISTEGQVDEEVNDYWSIVNTTTSGVQRINWDSNFKVHFPSRGTLKILVDVKFPERPEEGASKWDQYVAANAGQILNNRFYLFGLNSYVEHQLESEGKAVLYKGVYDTGMTTRYAGNTSTNYGSYKTNNTRLLYENGTGSVTYSDSDLKASTITYYTILYNGSYDRLYLSDLQDQLPRGFTFNSMCNSSTANYWGDSTNGDYKYINPSTSSSSARNYTSTSDTATYSNNFVGFTEPYNRYTSETITEGYTSTMSDRLVSIDKSADEYDNNTLRYVNARVAAATSNGSDGRQHITFTIKGNPSQGYGNSAIKYDSEVKKYYLNPGEAVRFGYNVLIDKYDKTDDLATNTITMPYYDYYGTGFILDAPDEEGNGGAVQKTRAVSGITANDGKCEMMTGTEVADQFGVDLSKYPGSAYTSLEGGNYMVSSVSVERALITPGVQKTIGGLTGKANNPGTTTIEGSQGSASASQLYGTAYRGGAKSSDVVNWKVRVFNESPGKNDEASGMMTGYTVTDTVDAPYKFTGQVFYNMYASGTANGRRVTPTTQYLFTIGSRKASDTKIRFSTGSSLSESGYRDVNIGIAEDNADDDWFTFGTGAKAGRVKLEKNAEGQEVLTIEMTGTGYSIPAGYWNDFCIHTMYPGDDIVISDTKYNDVILYPEQGYDPAKVAQGRARTKQVYDETGQLVTENDGIESGASITITQGYTTSAWKKITELKETEDADGNVTGYTDTTNTARSDEPNNYITLSEKTKKVKYDLFVIGPQDVMSKIVIIDDLPHVGDHSAFVEKDKRYSEFSVGFLEDNLGLKVSLAKKQGQTETLLNESQYDVYVTEKTEFRKDPAHPENDDWEGNGQGWTNLSGLSGTELKEVLAAAKSIRVVIKDPQAWIKQAESNYLMGVECQVHISFNARIKDENLEDDDENKPEPDEIAWNSFGYRYQVPQTRNGSEENSLGISLEAQPLNVGLKYPCAPLLKKIITEEVTREVEVEDPETGETTTEEVTEVVPRTAEKDLSFKLIVYEGEPLEALNDTSALSDSEVAQILREEERKYVYLPYDISAGESEKELGLWELNNCSTFDSSTEEFKASDDPWVWVNAKKYTIVELSTNKDVYDLSSIKIGSNTYEANNQVFTNSSEIKLQLTADNRYTELMLKKKLTEEVTKTVEKEDPETGGTTTEEVTEVKPHKLDMNLDFRFIVYEGEPLEALSDTSALSDNEVAATLNGADRKYIYIPYTITAGGSEKELNLRTINKCSTFDVTTNTFVESGVQWVWKDNTTYTIAELSLGKYIFDLESVQIGEDTHKSNNVSFVSNLCKEIEFTADNRYKPKYINVGGKKIWDDRNNAAEIRPESIKVELLANGEKVDETTVTPDEDGDWKYSFDHLLAQKEDGTVLTYTVNEEQEPHYQNPVIKDETPGAEIGDDKVYNITNKLEFTQVGVDKIWDDKDDLHKIRPESITVTLLANGKKYKEAEVKPDEDGSWAYDFVNLPRYDETWKEITYTVSEDKVKGYQEPLIDDTTPEDMEVGKEYTVTNIGLTQIEVDKEWDDTNNSGQLRPVSITVNLFANKEKIDTTTVTPDEDGNWHASFNDLPTKDENRQAIDYDIEEEEVEHYETSIDADKAKEEFKITNKLLPTELTGEKIWDDKEDEIKLRPEEIMIHLTANGERVPDKVYKLPNEDGSWTFKFDELPLVDENGIIDYAVEEDRVPHYREPVVEEVPHEEEGDMTREYKITNTIDSTEVSAAKTWDDKDNAAGLRPEEITYNLLANGEAIEEKTVTEEDEWKHTFTGLPVLDEKWEPIEYTVEEKEVKYYETTINKNEEGDFDVTNRCLVADLLITKKMPGRHSTGEGMNSTVVFKIEGKNAEGEVAYTNTVGIAFNDKSGESETRVIHKVPVDLTYTVTEVYSGGNYEPKVKTITKEALENYQGDMEDYKDKEVWFFEFENEFRDEDFLGDNEGIVNRYSNSEGSIEFKGGEE